MTDTENLLHSLHKCLAAGQTAITPEEIGILLGEVQRLRDVAAYLATLHANTAENDGMLKSTSPARRRRLQAICSSAVDLLQGRQSVERAGLPDAYAAAIERCERAARVVVNDNRWVDVPTQRPYSRWQRWLGLRRLAVGNSSANATDEDSDEQHICQICGTNCASALPVSMPVCRYQLNYVK
jgi:hypothetical protein